jgi:hypothetical protein
MGMTANGAAVHVFSKSFYYFLVRLPNEAPPVLAHFNHIYFFSFYGYFSHKNFYIAGDRTSKVMDFENEFLL